MRFGNTLEEMQNSEWIPFASQQNWSIRTGLGQQTLNSEFKFIDDSSHFFTYAIPEWNDSLLPYYLTPSSALSGLSDNLLLQQSFSESFDRWVSYDFAGPQQDGTNWFYPASWESAGGLGNTGYIWTDASRWRIDTPENSDSILSLLIYANWIDYPNNWALDLNGTSASFYLNSANLDLHGAIADFWLVDGRGRWHQQLQPLNIGDGTWSINTIDIGSDTTGWSNSWHGTNGEPLVQLVFTHIVSWGISFVGFPENIEVSGILAMDQFEITKREMSITGDISSENKLLGGFLADVIIGGNCDDIINGGGGSDVMIGLVGNDFYIVDNILDVVVEDINMGYDRIITSVSYKLSPGNSIEILSTADNNGHNSINLTGNELANTIYGNAGNNIIDGGGGSDVMIGLGGNDFFLFSSADKSISYISDLNPNDDMILISNSISKSIDLGNLSSNLFFINIQSTSLMSWINYSINTGIICYYDQMQNDVHNICVVGVDSNLSSMNFLIV